MNRAYFLLSLFFYQKKEDNTASPERKLSHEGEGGHLDEESSNGKEENIAESEITELVNSGKL